MEGRGYPGLVATLDLLKQKGIDVTVLGPIVEYDSALPRLLADDILHNKPSTASAMRTPGIHESAIGQCAGSSPPRVRPISPSTISVCHDGRCDEFAEGEIPMQFDAGHLTAEGSIEVGRRLSVSIVGKQAEMNHASN